MFSDLKIWEGKLAYLENELKQIEDIDKSWMDKDNLAHWHDLHSKTEKKVKEYRELVNYLRREE